MKHSTARRAFTQRTARDTSPVSVKDYVAAISVGRVEARFASRHGIQLEHLDNVLSAHRARIAQLEQEKRGLLARVQE